MTSLVRCPARWNGGRVLLVCLAATVSGWPRGASAQAPACEIPESWANAVRWTGTLSMTATGQGAIPPNGSYAIRQTVTGTVTLDQHVALGTRFYGTDSITVSADEHYEMPNAEAPPEPIDVRAAGTFTGADIPALILNLLDCKFSLGMWPISVWGTLVAGGRENPYLYALGPLASGPGIVTPTEPLTFAAIPTAATGNLKFVARYSAPTVFQGTLGSVDWEIVYDLTPEFCPPLQVPLLKQTADPWKWDTYDKFFESDQVLLARSTPASPGGQLELLAFPVGASQGAPGSARRYQISLSPADNNLFSLPDAIGTASAATVSSTLLGPDASHVGSRLSLSAEAINSLQLLSVPGDPTSNMLRRIEQFGCFLTSATMIVDYYAGGPVADPRAVNDWLNDQPDGFFGPNVNPAAVARFANTKYAAGMAFQGRVDERHDGEIERYLCAGNPVMLKVSPCSPQNPDTCPHFVVATGKTVANGALTWKINDPAFDHRDLGRYNLAYWGYRLFTGPSGVPGRGTRANIAAAAQANLNSLVVAAYPSAVLTVTDPSRRRSQCGDSAIPGSSCGTDAVQNDSMLHLQETTPPASIFTASAAASGSYDVEIAAPESGRYTVAVVAYDSTGGISTAKATGVAPPGTAAHHTISYSSAAGSQVTITGSPAAADGGPAAIADGGPEADGGSHSSLGGAGRHGCASDDAAADAAVAIALMGVYAATRRVVRGVRRR